MKVLFVFLHGIGDSIMFTPAVRLYHDKHPDRKIGILCTPLNKTFWESHPLLEEVFVSEFKEPPHHGNLPRYLIERIKIQQQINKIKKEYHYDKVEYIVPHSWRILECSIPIPGILRRLFTLRFEKHETLKLCSRLRVGDGLHWLHNFKQEIFITPKHQRKAQAILKKIKNTKPLCILHAQASSPNKSFTPEEKDDAIDLLKENYTVCVLQEKAHRSDVQELITPDVMVSAAIFKTAKLFIGVDSGPAHIAEVLHIPHVIITKAFKSDLLYLTDKRTLLLDSYDKKKVENFLVSELHVK